MMRSVVLQFGPSSDRPWWLDEISLDSELCPLDHVRFNFRGKGSRDITAFELPLFMLKLLRVLLSLRRKYDYLFTMETDLLGLGIAFWQTVLFMRRPRHVIIHFIMREKTSHPTSRLKYAFMQFIFQSVYRAICSSRIETDYYREQFGWSRRKAQFVPMHASAAPLQAVTEQRDYLIAAGRVFRDYATAIRAIQGTPFKLIIVGGPGTVDAFPSTEKVEVMQEIPLQQLNELVRRSAAVLLPLQDRKISAGQLVLLEAMAAGKLVIATRTAGTIDYVEHMVNGILVAPGDVAAMREAILAATDRNLRDELGRRARDLMATRHMPHHYTAAIRRTLA